nr:hypothetical protein [Flavobacteriales bacterium]
MRPLTALLFIPLVFGCSTQEREAPEYVLPAEWEPHEAVWFSYYGDVTDTVLDKVVLAMDTATLVVCAVEGDSVAKSIA